MTTEAWLALVALMLSPLPVLVAVDVLHEVAGR